MLFRFLPRLAVQRPVLATMLVVVFVVLGVFSFFQLNTDLYPDVEFPVVSITTTYPGAGPEEVERQVTEPIEDAVSNIANLDELTSFSRENISIVILMFDLEVDADLAAIDVKDQVDAIRALLPSDSDPPTVQKFDVDAFPIMNLALSGPQGVDALYEFADEEIQERLSRVDGVADVSVVGGREREVEVLADPDLLEAFGVTLNDLVDLIRAENLSVPGGRLADPLNRLPIRVLGEYNDLRQLEELPVLLPDGGSIPLGELAIIRDGYEDQEQLARLNGQSAVSISVQKQADANTIEVADQVLVMLDEIRADLLPPGSEISVVQDGSEFIRDAVLDVLQAMAIGILLTTLVLFLFLHSIRATIIAGIAMPATILCAFLLLDQAGLTLNVMTLLALGVTVGILVTNTIVVLENIYRFLDLGYSPEEAAEEGTAEVGVAVAASVLTNVVVFTPIAFMGGIIGQFFYAFGLTVVFATVFSLFISFLLAPLMGARLLRRHETKLSGKARMAPVWKAWDGGYDGLTSTYRNGLKWALARPRNGWMVIGMVSVFFVGSLVLSGNFVDGEFMPTADEGIIEVNLELPPGASLFQTENVVIRAEDLLADVEDVESVLATVAGGTGFMAVAEAENRAQVLVTLREDRARISQEVTREIRPLMAQIPDAEVTIQLASSVGGPGAEAPIVVEITGPDLELETITESLTQVVASVEGLTDVRNTIEDPRPELTFRPDREALADLGLTVGQVGDLVRGAVQGTVAGVFRSAGDEIDIRVRLPEEERLRPEQVAQIRVPTSAGLVPLEILGEVVEEETIPAIRRVNRQRAYDIEAELASGALTERVGQVQERLGQESLPPGYSWHVGGEFEDFGEALAEILQALLLAIILTYIVLAMILESFIQPITIMLTLPLGAAGAFLALMLAGVPLNIFGMMAIVMLVGIVVNNAILILDYAGQLRAKGKSAVEALMEAAPVRLRPILMSNVAIAVALIPQALGTGAGAVFRVPMAVVTIGGVVVAAVLTIFLIPVIYLKMDRVAVWLHEVGDRLKEATGGNLEWSPEAEAEAES